jgi:hypothetical protein
MYHLPSWFSTRKLDGFGNGWLAPETAVRTDRVVVSQPAFRHDLRFLERVEQLAVEKRRPHSAIIMKGYWHYGLSLTPGSQAGTHAGHGWPWVGYDLS